MKWEGRRQSTHIEIAPAFEEKTTAVEDTRPVIRVPTILDRSERSHSLEERDQYDSPQYVRFFPSGRALGNFLESKQRIEDLRFVFYMGNEKDPPEPMIMALILFLRRVGAIYPNMMFMLTLTSLDDIDVVETLNVVLLMTNGVGL